MRAILSPDDLKIGNLVEPDWYPCDFSNYKEDVAKTDKSANCVFYFKCFDGPSKGAIFRTQYNEKALGFGKELWAVMFGAPDPEKGYELTTEKFKSMVGNFKVKVHVKRGKSDKGNEFNEIDGFMPMS